MWGPDEMLQKEAHTRVYVNSQFIEDIPESSLKSFFFVDLNFLFPLLPLIPVVQKSGFNVWNFILIRTKVRYGGRFAR